MEMSAPSFKDESSPLRASKNGSTVPSSSPFFLHTSSKLADSSSGLGNRRENIISFQQFPGPRAVPDADIEPGFVAPYVIDKPSVAKKSKRRENPLPMFMNGVCNETVPVPSQKRKRVNGKAVGNDENAEKSACQKQNATKWRPMDNQSSPYMNQVDNSQAFLGMYGLDARTLDLSGYANDISLEQLMAHQPGVSVKPEIRRPVMNNNFFGAHANPSLHNLARPLQEETPAPFICTAKPIDSKPHRLMLDLEAPPMDETEEIALHDMSNAKAFPSGSNMMFLDNRKQMSMQYPVDISYPPAEFLSNFQHPPSEPLDRLRTQVEMPLENKFSSFDIVQPSQENMNRIPPMFFQFNSSQAIQHENPCENFVNPAMNDWHKAESPMMAPLKSELLQNCVGNRFPFAVEPENIETKSIRKHRADGFDIDLNKQSSEAEAAELSIDTREISPESTCLAPSEPNALNAQSSDVVPTEQQHNAATTSALHTVDQPTVASEVIDHAITVDEEVLQPTGETHDKDGAGEKKNSDPGSQSLPLTMDKQENAFDKLEADLPSLPNNTTTASAENETKKQENTQDSEALEAAITSVSNSFPRLSLPDGQEAEDGWNDVPYSPGVQATARLLCKMASSSSPFYTESDDAGRSSPLHKGASPIRRHGKATRTVGAHEIGMEENEEQKSWDENLHKVSLKARARDAKDVAMFNDKANSSTHANAKRNGLIHAPHESRPMTPPRTTARNSPSSRSDVSSKSPVKESTVNDVCGKANRIRSDQISTTGSSKVSTNSYTKKESKGTPTVGSNTKFIFTSPSKCLSSSIQRKNEMMRETKQSIQGDGLSKLPHPHTTNSSKSCLTSQKTSSNCSVKPGFPAKAPRQVVPYVGEIRYGSK